MLLWQNTRAKYQGNILHITILHQLKPRLTSYRNIHTHYDRNETFYLKVLDHFQCCNTLQAENIGRQIMMAACLTRDGNMNTFENDEMPDNRDQSSEKLKEFLHLHEFLFGASHTRVDMVAGNTYI